MKITFGYTEIHHRILPTVATTRTSSSSELLLTPGGEVITHETRVSGQAHGNYERSGKLGGDQGPTWKVAARNELINLKDHVSYTRAIIVSIDRDRNCGIRVGYDLKPGFTDYRYRRLFNGELAVATSVEAEDKHCSIVELK